MPNVTERHVPLSICSPQCGMTWKARKDKSSYMQGVASGVRHAASEQFQRMEILESVEPPGTNMQVLCAIPESWDPCRSSEDAQCLAVAKAAMTTKIANETCQLSISREAVRLQQQPIKGCAVADLTTTFFWMSIHQYKSVKSLSHANLHLGSKLGIILPLPYHTKQKEMSMVVIPMWTLRRS